MQETPTQAQIDVAVNAAIEAAGNAADVRSRLGRRRTPRRAQQLALARERCADAALLLRSYIGMIAWHDLPVDQEIAMKDAMTKLRYARRQIDKMKL